jgi:UDP-N-acetylglucosamine 2-epimerase (non-hydrolysing)
MKKILIILGTRPEAIKMAPLIKALKECEEDFCIRICVTGQHREMLDSVLKLFDIEPDYDLNLMKQNQDIFDISTKVLSGLKTILQKELPDMVLVHGDTTTSVMGALASFYLQIPVGHIEAGLRTCNRYSPFPEEVNRQITGRIAALHFAPTEQNYQNLMKENISKDTVFITGNTGIDALLSVVKRIKEDESVKKQVIESIENFIPKEKLDRWIQKKRKLILITGHRRENFGQGFLDICHAIKELSLKYPDIDFVYPMHLNPNVRKAVKSVFTDNDRDNCYFTEPVDYLSFIFLLSLSYIILTDSGGIQEEASALNIPVLVMRDTTERPEAVWTGTAKLVGTNTGDIIEEVGGLIDNNEHYKAMVNSVNPYGDGRASERIVDILKK